MGQDITIRDLEIADDSLYKTQRVQIGSKSIITPIKVMDLNRFLPGVPINDSVKGVNEIVKKFNSERINTATSTNREQEINNEINRKFRSHSSEEEVNFCFAEFEEDKIPTEDELDYLTNLSHVHSDITPLPILQKHFKGVKNEGVQKFESFHKFVKDAIASINVLNHKPIMGIIPMAMPSQFIPTLMDTYANEGIHSICLDYQGSTVGSSLTKIRKITKTIKQRGLLEKTFTYSLNLGPGKLPKSKTVVPAKDILSYGFGFDAIGGIHVQKKLPPEVRQKILSVQNIFENSLRLFNKENYGYYRTNDNSIIQKVYPTDSKIPINLLQNINTNSKVDKLFNQEQQGLEAVNLRRVIKERVEMLKYLDKKEYVEKNDIKNLDNIKKK